MTRRFPPTHPKGAWATWRRVTPTWAPAALALLLWLALPRPGVWLDEAATVSATSRTWPEMVRLVHHQDASLSGYYAVIWAVARALGVDTLTAGRLVSGLSCVAATLVVTLIGRRLGSPRTALIGGCLFAVLPSTSASAANARPEALACALVAGFFLAAVTRRRVLQFALGLAACAVYALDVMYLPLAGLLLVIAPRMCDSRERELAPVC